MARLIWQVEVAKIFKFKFLDVNFWHYMMDKMLKTTLSLYLLVCTDLGQFVYSNLSFGKHCLCTIRELARLADFIFESFKTRNAVLCYYDYICVESFPYSLIVDSCVLIKKIPNLLKVHKSVCGASLWFKLSSS